MIIVKLQGGLGNQMFQYALGRALSLRHNTPLAFDWSYLQKPNQSSRTLRIEGLTVSLKEVSPEEIDRYTGTASKIMDRFRPETKKKKIIEKGACFDSKILERNDGYFDGHWQTPKYFEGYEKILRQEFTLKNPLGEKATEMLAKIQSEKNPVSVHIRRGDYVSIPKIAEIHRALPLSYYESAMEKIRAALPDASFFVFSDDIVWAKEHFPKKYPVTFVSSLEIPDYEEMSLMKNCNHHITANSTFSWWAAWLCDNPQKTVIAPKQWFKNPTRAIEDLIPPTWIQL